MIRSRRIRWAGDATRVREKRNVCRILVAKPEGKRPLGRPGRRWVDTIKMDLREVGWGGIDWIEDRDQRRDAVKMVMNSQIP
jgi:hypothetical protein